MKRKVLLLVALLVACFEPRGRTAGFQALQSEPVIRIGLDQNAAAVTVRSGEEFTVQEQTARSAKFSNVLAVDPNATPGVLAKEDLRYRISVELDGGRFLILPAGTRVQIQPHSSSKTGRLQVGERTYRGAIEIFANSRNTLTAVNELPLEQYLLGVVPNELSPATFGQIEALKAQAVAARTYAIKNMGQYRREGYDVCDTDACQVYMGAGTEDALTSQAVEETRGLVALYDNKPINALYTSTCGGRTESAENIFDEKTPYLVSTFCEYKHPDPKPFASTRSIPDYKQAVLTIAGVSNFTDLRHFLGLPGMGEPASMELSSLAAYLRQNFYPNVKPVNDADFLIEQGILSGGGPFSIPDVLFRLIDRKGAFEWQQGVLTAWDGQTMRLTVNNQPADFQLSPDALIFSRVGDDRTATKEGAWIGGELFDFRAVNGVIQMAVYRRNFAEASADRYSRLAVWQTHKTRQELDTAFRSLNLGQTQGIRVVERGPSERPISTEIIGSRTRTAVRALRLRTLLGLRDSLFYFDEERNAKGDLIGISFFGRGWGHGVGMCQVGAFGMALDGATFEQILKKYYHGIEIKKSY
jgi:peptidoglycan hydrolase-like amidase